MLLPRKSGRDGREGAVGKPNGFPTTSSSALAAIAFGACAEAYVQKKGAREGNMVSLTGASRASDAGADALTA